jgi:hypothetical protein
MAVGDRAAKVSFEAALRVGKEAMKRAAANEKVRKAAGTAGLWLGRRAGEMAAARSRNRRRALALARQVGGQYSRGTIVADRERWVVWKNAKAIACFPPLAPEQLDGGMLGDRQELQDFNTDLLVDPPPMRGRS